MKTMTKTTTQLNISLGTPWPLSITHEGTAYIMTGKHGVSGRVYTAGNGDCLVVLSR